MFGLQNTGRFMKNWFAVIKLFNMEAPTKEKLETCMNKVRKALIAKSFPML
jgi:hypothetical protein